MQINLNTIFKLLATLLVVSLIALFSSCDIYKEASKSKTDSSLKDQFTKHSFRSGDSVSYRPGKVIFKDTTIYRVTKNNTRLETVYDSNGNIRDINCYAAQIEELTKRNLELEQASKDKESLKTEKFDSTFILYIIFGVVTIVVFGFTLMFILIKQNTNATSLILKQIAKQ